MLSTVVVKSAAFIVATALLLTKFQLGPKLSVSILILIFCQFPTFHRYIYKLSPLIQLPKISTQILLFIFHTSTVLVGINVWSNTLTISHLFIFSAHIPFLYPIILLNFTFLLFHTFSLSLSINSSSGFSISFSVKSCIFTPHILPQTVPSLRSSILVTAQPLVVTFAILVFLSPHALVLATKSPSSSIST